MSNPSSNPHSHKTLVLGTRSSLLARTQSQWVADFITAKTGIPVRLEMITTKGDVVLNKPLAQIGGKGLFTAELEEALHQGVIDFAVHSLKDLPTENPNGLVVNCLPKREDPRDALVGKPLQEVSVLGTGSIRRQAQIQKLQSTLVCEGIRGNVDTRISKMENGDYDAVVLAMAGLNRLGLSQTRTDIHPLSVLDCIPAPGQGILGVQSRQDREDITEILQTIHDPETALCATAERQFLDVFGGGCHACLGAYATIENGTIALWAFVENAIGQFLKWRQTGDDPVQLGTQMAIEMRETLAHMK